MRDIQQLGISKMPWSYDGGVLHDDDYSEIVSGCEDGFGGSCVEMKDADARLIAAAPELYEALREAVETRCGICGQTCKKCECLVKSWRNALAKAAGDEVAE